MRPLQCVLQQHVPIHAAITMRFAFTRRRTPRENNFDLETTPAATAAHRRYLSSPPAATLHGKTWFRAPASQHKPHATFMQPLQCVLQHHVANLHVSAHMKTKQNVTTIMQHHAASCCHYTAISKHGVNKRMELRTGEQPHVAERSQPQPPHTRGTFHCHLQPLCTEKRMVSCSGFLPNTSPMQHSFCNHVMQSGM